MGNELGGILQPVTPTNSTNMEDFYQNERGCECGFIPFQTKDDFRSELIAIRGHIPSFDMNRNGQCECGFTPNIDKTNHDFSLYWKIDSFKTNRNLSRKCSIQMALRNHNIFPAIDTLMRWKRVIPRHWCTLIEIHNFTQNEDFTVVEGNDLLNNYEAKVYFDASEKSPQTFTWSQMKRGAATLAVLYPEVKKDENNSPEIHVTDLSRCFVFNASLPMVKHEAHMLMEDANQNRQDSKCFCCGISNAKFTDKTMSMLRCSSCKLAKYCSRKCQAYAWKESHKGLCGQSEMLLRLTALPVVHFEGRLTFDTFEKKNSLPAYMPNVNMRPKTEEEAMLPGMRLSCGGHMSCGLSHGSGDQEME